MKISDITFTLECTSEIGQTHIVKWEDAAVNRKYHIWIYSGRLDTTLHSNWIVPHGNARVGTHRALSIHSAKWVSLVKHIVDHITTPAALAQATKAYEDSEAEKKERAEEAREARARAAITTLANSLRASAVEADRTVGEMLINIAMDANRAHLEQLRCAFVTRGL